MYGVFCQRSVIGRTLFRDLGFYESSGKFLPFGGRTISSDVGGVSLRSEKKQRDVEACRAYLVNSFGLSAKKAENVIRTQGSLKPGRADAVLKILRGHGFDDSQVLKLVKKAPQVIFLNGEKIILPKMRFFSSIGMTSEDLARVVTANPTLLLMSLEKSLVPKLEFLKTLLVDDDDIVKAMKSNSWIFLVHGDRNLVPNVTALIEAGVPKHVVRGMMKRCASIVIQSREKFATCLDEVIKMGFHPKESSFIYAMHVFSSTIEASRDRRKDILRRCGMSEREIQSMFKKRPKFMLLSDKKLMSKMEFLVKDMRWSPSDIAWCPSLFDLSLENRLIPRCSVIRLLQLKSLVGKDLKLSTFLMLKDKAFYDKFVACNIGKIPQLLDVYKGKMSASAQHGTKQRGCYQYIVKHCTEQIIPFHKLTFPNFGVCFLFRFGN